jgi:hypothetical protein
VPKLRPSMPWRAGPSTEPRSAGASQIPAREPSPYVFRAGRLLSLYGLPARLLALWRSRTVRVAAKSNSTAAGSSGNATTSTNHRRAVSLLAPRSVVRWRTEFLDRKAAPAQLLRDARGGIRLNHIAEDGPIVFAHARRLGAEGIVSKRIDSTYQSGSCRVRINVGNPASIAVRRERSETWKR